MILTPLADDRSEPTDDVCDDLLGFASPCVRCLHGVEPRQSASGVSWHCPNCGLARIG